MDEQANAGWTEDEFGAAVGAYMQMLRDELAGWVVVKASVNRTLHEGALSERSPKSIEFRMANISAVLDEMGLPFIDGYKPMRNVGPHGTEVIRRFVKAHPLYAEIGATLPTADEDELNDRVRHLLNNQPTEPPSGNETPEAVDQSRKAFKRDPAVKAWVLRESNGICELCDQAAPFEGVGGFPFLEVHHVVTLADGGPDTISNAAALCPNCHRRCHYSVDRDEAVEALYGRVERLKR